MSTARTRADRLRLVERLELAEHAADLLHSKEEALERERVRLTGHADRAALAWRDAAAAASRATVRARCLGAGDEIDRLVAPSPAEVVPHWQHSMGITYPGDVTVVPGERPPLTATAALGPAIDAHRTALAAAADHAAAAMALDRLDAELAATRRRRRALEDHLRPQLHRRLADLDLALDELDREEALRTRIAVAGHAGDRPHDPIAGQGRER